KVETVFDLVDAIINPGRLRALTAARISFFASELRRNRQDGEQVRHGLAESSIKAYLAHLKAALRWAARTGLLAAAPTFPKITRAKDSKGSTPMKGRPITTEEFERMLGKVPVIVGDARPTEWCRLLSGLWWSGLRLGEAMALSWDAGTITVDLDDDDEPVFVIPPEAQKNHKLQLVPMAPEFADELLNVPVEERVGLVFNPAALDGSGRRASQSRACRTIADIGEAAGVKVHFEPRTQHVKFASAHDLRRAFGERWAARVTTPMLQQMMRHETVTTTLRFYAGRNAKAVARAARAAYKALPSNTSGNTAHFGDAANSRK
ncbi:MAG TPA: site-specific integrase, partial [Pirellulales bacterium]|nr:site-specific integrase [Pirellulales bacterium]